MTATRPSMKPRLLDIFAAYQAGESINLIARRLGVTRQRIFQIVKTVAKRLGVARRPKIPATGGNVWNGKIALVVPEDLANDWFARRKTAREIADALGVCRHTVEFALRRQRPGVRRSPTLCERVYAAYKEGATIRELATRFGVTENFVGVMIVRTRQYDPNPYYRRRPRRPLRGRPRD